MQITAKDTADFYNGLFFDDNANQVEPEISILIEHGDKQLIIPKAKVTAKMEFHNLILNFHRQLEQEGPLELTEVPQFKQEGPPLIDFQQIEYRDRIYFVEQTDKDIFRVLNEARNKEISLKSPLAKILIKKFKEAY